MVRALLQSEVATARGTCAIPLGSACQSKLREYIPKCDCQHCKRDPRFNSRIM